MDAHQIGLQLRAQVLRDRQQGRPLDPRRLQALIGDLCAEGQQELVVPLRYLVLSAAFASAAGMDPPLADGRLLPRLQNELAQVYAAPLCARLQPLLEGLVGLPAAAPAAAAEGLPAAAAWPSGSPPTARDQAPHRGDPPVAAAPRGGPAPLNAWLAFLSGLLLMALAGLALLLWQRQSAEKAPRPGAGAGSGPSQVAGGQAPRPSQQLPVESVPASPTPPARQETAREVAAPLDRAVGSIQQLYQALSAKDFNQAQALFGSAAADQFDPGFFRQFERVSVQDLRSTSQVGSTLNLEGVVSFVWPDGSIQTESRTFSVDTSSDPALITASEFGRVLKPR